MGMITLNISNVAAWAVTIIAVEVTAPSFFALASLIHGARARAKRTWAGARPPLSLLERLKRFAAIIALTGTLIAVVSAADFAWELTDQEYSTWGLLVNWVIIAIATASVYVSVVRAFGKERARKWAAATGMISIGIVLLPPVIFQAPDQLKPDAWFEGMVVGDWYVRLVLSRINCEIVSPCGIALMLLILVASLGLGFLRSARPFMAASALPALFFFSLAKPPLTSPPHQLDLVYWAEPAIVLIAVCAIIFVVFGEGGGHSKREYPTSATADA